MFSGIPFRCAEDRDIFSIKSANKTFETIVCKTLLHIANKF